MVGGVLSDTDVLTCDWVNDNLILATTETGRIVFVNPWTNESHLDVATNPPGWPTLKDAHLSLRGVPVAVSRRNNWTAVSVAAITEDGEFTRIYETDTGQVVANLSPFRRHAVIELEDPQIYARCLCFSNDSKWLFEGAHAESTHGILRHGLLLIIGKATSDWWENSAQIEDSLFAVPDVRETAMRFLPTNPIVLERSYPVSC